MKTHLLVWPSIVAAVCLSTAPTLQAQGAPDIVWEAITPSALANSIQGVDWSPVASGNVVFGSTDRWLRTRQAETGALSYSVLQPHRSGGVDQALYSSDGNFIAVHNSSGGLDYRVHRAADGVFLGLLDFTIDEEGMVRLAPDSQLIAAVGGDGTLSRWPIDHFTVSVTVGSGYDRTNTTFNFSPDGTLQSAARQGTITIRQRRDGAIVRILTGGRAQGSTPVAFAPDSHHLAAWSENPNQVTLWRISDGVALMKFSGAAQEGVGTIRFTPGGGHLVTTGYLPFVGSDGLGQQKGMIRFWRVADGTLQQTYDSHTGLAVTSPVAWSPDAARFAYGTYEGTAVVAQTPTAILPERAGPLAGNGEVRLEMFGQALLQLRGKPGTGYEVEASTDLLTWTSAGVTTANASGYCEFLDTNSHRFSLRFYRMRQRP